jgi:2-keto-4-pentenoate hydratase
MIGRLNRAAGAILEARRTGALLDTLAPNDQPRSLEEGYTIQQLVTAEWPDKIAGWKVGATSKAVQALLGMSEPAYGPVFKNDVFQSPAAISGQRFPHRCSNPSSPSDSGNPYLAGQNPIPGMKSPMRLMLYFRF